MADSDSEAFESADEDVEEKKHHRTPSASKIKSPDPPQPIQSTKVETETPVEPAQSSWRSWGAFNVISNASKTVASLTTHVSQSITTAIDSMNIPDPEEMAKIQAEEKKKAKENSSAEDQPRETPSDDSVFKLDSLFSGVSQISSKVVSGGLDTLEGLGKKTINIIQETDPNIGSKLRGLGVSTSKPNLSDLLKEAKEREKEMPEEKNSTVRLASFEHLLDEFKGLVFLEALEILSNQSKMQIELLLKPLDGKILTEMEETLEEVKELCDFDAESFDETITNLNLEQKLATATEDLTVKLNFSEIIAFAKESQNWLDKDDDGSASETNEIYNKSISVMAKACALALNNLQKLAELLLSQDHRNTADEADSLTLLATTYCSLFNFFAIQFTRKLTAKGDPESKKLATNVFLESSSAITQIKKAFNLFLPILQIGAV